MISKDRFGALNCWRSQVMLPESSFLVATPWQNPYAERFIGSLRRECLDHSIIAMSEEPPESVHGFQTAFSLQLNSLEYRSYHLCYRLKLFETSSYGSVW